MSAWTLTSQGLPFCTRHSVEFARGQMCPHCVIDPPPEEALTESQFPDGEDLPCVVDHERWFVQLSERCALEAASYLEDMPAKRASKRAKGQKARKANPILSVKLYECAIKARRAALETTRWREGGKELEKLEEELRKMRGAH